MRLHICRPWRWECGNVLRINLHLKRGSLGIACHPNACFERKWIIWEPKKMEVV